jgi:hypothetical protein
MFAHGGSVAVHRRHVLQVSRGAAGVACVGAEERDQYMRDVAIGLILRLRSCVYHHGGLSSER